MTSLLFVGCLIGACTGGYLCDYFGRKWTIYIVCVVFIIGSLTLTLASTLGTIYFGRVLVGIGVAFSAIVDIAYLTEVSPESLRGAVVATNDLMVAVGLLFAYGFGYAFSDVDDGWRAMFAVPLMMSIVWAIAMCFMPESPKWLLLNSRNDEAKAVYALSTTSDGETERLYSRALAEVEVTKKSAQLPLWSILHEWRYASGLAIFLVVAQNLSGQGNVLFYSVDMFSGLGLGGDAAGTATITLGVVKVVCTIVSIATVDIIGRKRTLVIGTAIMTVSIFLFCIFTGSVADDKANALLGIISICVFVGAYALGYGPVTWLVASELFPDSVRGRALAFVTLFNWASGLLATGTFLSMMKSLGTVGTFLFYSVRYAQTKLITSATVMTTI